jgi:3-methyladenine DNA glycosylase AlkD
MRYKDLFIDLEKNENTERAIPMSNYMKNNFAFLGIQKPKLNEIIKPYIKECKNEKVDWNFVSLCWDKPYREAQYTAVEYLLYIAKTLTDKDLAKLKKIIVVKSWWDSIDEMSQIVGNIVSRHNHLEKVMLAWSKDKNIWLRRVAILFQLKYKEKTNQDLLSQIILNNFETTEFFINKAIGWSLREYSKTNKVWVKNFINKHKNQLHKLSIREGSKYI